MKLKKIWIITLILTIFIWGCKKDNYTEVAGVCPVVASTNPVNLATKIQAGQVITATFNEKIDPKTITASSFSLRGLTDVQGTLTYNEANATLSFVPATPLTPNTTFTAKVIAPVRDFSGSALQTDYVWTFSTGDTLSPIVIATDPINNATGVAINKIVRATFSMPMDSLSINAITFTLKQGTTPITGIVSANGSMATFTPSSPLASNIQYTATITKGAKNKAGTPLTSDYVWVFTTGATNAPTVISTDPVNNATGVFLNKVIKATFSMAMNPSTITSVTYTLKQGTTPITGIISYSGTTASFTPSNPLIANTLYTATITTGAKNMTGDGLTADYVWTFTTGTITAPIVISTDPNNNASGVVLNKIVSATFNTPMDPLTINSSTFTLKQGTTTVAGSVSYSGSTATFTPSSNLSSGNTYTATITTGAKNMAGTPLANNYIWNFATKNPAGPPVVNLKSVEPFGIIAGVGISNNAGFSVINDMNVGISPGVRSSVTGFPPAIVVNGAIYASDDANPPGIAATLVQAKQDLTDAYLYAEGATTPAPATVSGDIGGTTLAPGIYKSTSTLLIQSGDLTLDAQGDPNATWIFQIASGFTTVGGAGGNVILTGGAQAKNIFWQTGSSATVGDFTIFQGTILALTSITMNSGATANGRMLVQNGSVVLTNTNIINKP